MHSINLILFILSNNDTIKRWHRRVLCLLTLHQLQIVYLQCYIHGWALTARGLRTGSGGLGWWAASPGACSGCWRTPRSRPATCSGPDDGNRPCPWTGSYTSGRRGIGPGNRPASPVILYTYINDIGNQSIGVKHNCWWTAICKKLRR